MNRRHVLKGMGVLTLYASFPAVITEFLSSCNAATRKMRAGFFTDPEFELIEQITETLIPPTSTPGAMQAKVPLFIDLVVKDCLKDADQLLIRKGLKDLQTVFKGSFENLSAEEKTKMLRDIDDAAFKDQPNATWFRIFKKLATIGYFTSQEGMNKALRYIKVPGDYKACTPYAKGDKAQAKTFLMYW